MIFFKRKKNYLKRVDFINLSDSKKIWSMTMTLSEVKTLLDFLKSEIEKYDFDYDENFMMNSRRKILCETIDDNLGHFDIDFLKNVLQMLFNLWEFVSDEYSGSDLDNISEFKISLEEFHKKDKLYRDKGVICSQEKDVIINIIDKLIKYLNDCMSYYN